MFKTLIFFSKKEQILNNYISVYLDYILEYLLENLKLTKQDHIIVKVAKCIRKLFQVEDYLKKFLTFEFFSELYFFAKKENFMLSKEMFKCIFKLIISPKVNTSIFETFLRQNKEELCGLINSAMNNIHLDTNPNCYFLKRETLRFIEKLLEGPIFENFKEYYVNNPENLKMVMTNLGGNGKYNKILIQATFVLHYFFQDIESKDKTIRKILHANKQNFYKFFEQNDEIFNSDPEMIEKKNFILYELERLENLD
jgi:hypothetical protein